MRAQATQPSRKPIWVVSALGGIVTVALIAGVIVLSARARSTSSPTATPLPSLSAAPTLAHRIDGIPCNTQAIGYHVHAHLQIVYEGRNLALPKDIGINDNTCIYYLHTHDNSGELHIEAPEFHRFTLGQFFDVWKQPLTANRLAPLHVAAGKYIRAYVNGHVFRGNPRSIPLTPHRLIALEVGPPFTTPSTFDFQGD